MTHEQEQIEIEKVKININMTYALAIIGNKFSTVCNEHAIAQSYCNMYQFSVATFQEGTYATFLESVARIEDVIRKYDPYENTLLIYVGLLCSSYHRKMITQLSRLYPNREYKVNEEDIIAIRNYSVRWKIDKSILKRMEKDLVKLIYNK